MAKPPLEVDGYFVPRLVVEANHDYDPGKHESHEAIVTVNPMIGQNKHDHKNYRIQLDIEVKPDAEAHIPYNIELTVIGVFNVHDHVPEAERTDIAAITGTSILYSAARELVLAVTGRGPWEAYMLPAYSFGDLKGIVSFDGEPLGEEGKVGKGKPSNKKAPGRKKNPGKASS